MASRATSEALDTEHGRAASSESTRGRRDLLGFLGSRRTDIQWGAASPLVSLVAVAGALRLWKMHPNIPIFPGGDGVLTLMTVKTMQTHGWALTTPDLGAPLGQNLAAWPATVGDTWNLVALKILSLFLTPAATVNVYFLLCFPLVAIVAYGSLRALRTSPSISFALSVAYALLPYHFLRNESHLYLSAYYAVPAACVIAVAIFEDRLKLFGRRRLTRHGWLCVGAAVVLAGTGLYYAVFAVVLFFSAALVASLSARRLRPLAVAAVPSVIILAGLALAAIPNLIYKFVDHGTLAVDGRSYAASEYFGLKIVNLLLPLASHRLSFLAHLHAATADSFIPGEGSETLGVLGSVGFIAATLAVLAPVIGARSARSLRLRTYGALTVFSVLWATVAGVNGLLAALGFGALRAWDRMSVFIAFFALAAFGILVDSLLRRLSGPMPVLSRAAVAAGLVVLAFFDQTSNAFIPNYPADAQGWDRDAAYFSTVQHELGAGTAVFTLPVVPFPENPPVVNMPDYNQLRGYLHSDLKWSYGGVKDGASDWQQAAILDGVSQALPKLVAAGFDAVYVNRAGYVDHGVSTEAQIQATTGVTTPMVSADGLLATYDIRDYAARLRASGSLPNLQSVLHPLSISYGDGVYALESSGQETWHWAQAVAQATATNPTQQVAKARLVGKVRVASPTATVTVRIGSAATTLQAVNGVATVDVPCDIPPGAEAIVITTDSAETVAPGDTRSLYQQLVGLHLEETATGS